jgi:NAD(P)-dependent dehydrogenase (short-subunit alcohol dehydrogenase family)
MKIIVTGGAGFIGSNFVRYILSKEPDAEVINFDKLTYAGNLENLKDVESDPRYTFVRGDIAVEAEVRAVLTTEIDVVVHFAAESHVDRSIEDASAFIDTNVRGTYVLLQVAREMSVERFIHVSTDEVYGSLRDDEPSWTEASPLMPNSPYSASKAASDLLVRKRSPRPDVSPNTRVPRHHPAILEQLRPLPVSGKADSPHDHERRERTAASRVWPRRERARLALRGGSLRGAPHDLAGRDSRRGIQHRRERGAG